MRSAAGPAARLQQQTPHFICASRFARSFGKGTGPSSMMSRGNVRRSNIEPARRFAVFLIASISIPLMV